MPKVKFLLEITQKWKSFLTFEGLEPAVGNYKSAPRIFSTSITISYAWSQSWAAITVNPSRSLALHNLCWSRSRPLDHDHDNWASVPNLDFLSFTLTFLFLVSFQLTSLIFIHLPVNFQTIGISASKWQIHLIYTI